MAKSVAVGREADRHNETGKQNEDGRTPAQWYCYIAGALLTLLGLLGFLADSTFDTSSTGVDEEGGNAGGGLQGDSFLGFEVNGWHNVVHLVTGIILLAMAGKRKSAKPAALGVGAFYAVVAIIGLIDGNDVLGILPVNPADNILHIVLALLGIATGLLSDADDRDRSHRDTTAPGCGRDTVSPGSGRDVASPSSGRVTRARAHEGGPADADRARDTARRGEARGDDTLPPEDHDRTSGRR